MIPHKASKIATFLKDIAVDSIEWLPEIFVHPRTIGIVSITTIMTHKRAVNSDLDYCSMQGLFHTLLQ